MLAECKTVYQLNDFVVVVVAAAVEEEGAVFAAADSRTIDDTGQQTAWK